MVAFAHGRKCECVYCTNPAQAARQEKEALREYGWFARGVADAPGYYWNTTIHTYGFELHGHLNFQIICPTSPHRVIMPIFQILYKAVVAGKVFQPEEVSDDVLEGYQVKFVTVKESGRDVLRVILPDKEGHLNRDNMAEPYVHQYDDFPA